MNPESPPARPPSEPELADDVILAHIEQMMAEARERAASGVGPAPTPPEPGSTWW